MTSVDLFSPLDIGGLSLSNRIVMAPLTRSRAAAGNVPHALNALYYAQRAGAGLIVSEATQICEEGQGYVATPGIHSDAQIAGWRMVTQAVHAAGGHIFLQLWHVGRISHRFFQPHGALPVAPSAIKPEGRAYIETGFVDLETPRALLKNEIGKIVEKYAQGALNAIQAGFDGVEVHAANGYLIDQFLRDGANQRADEYGGSIENRCRFFNEVLDAVTTAVGPLKVGVRISPQNSFNDMRDSDPQALFGHVANCMHGRGLAYLHVVEGEMDGSRPPGLDYGVLRERFGGVYIANGGYDYAKAQTVLENGSATAVAFGQKFIANPDLVTRFRLGLPLNEPQQETFYGGSAAGYTNYPFATAV
ncbi:MAG: alkene reductase [Burkholderiaceae bacterium]|jgi:N-ethylmaleimide reductase